MVVAGTSIGAAGSLLCAGFSLGDDGSVGCFLSLTFKADATLAVDNEVADMDSPSRGGAENGSTREHVHTYSAFVRVHHKDMPASPGIYVIGAARAVSGSAQELSPTDQVELEFRSTVTLIDESGRVEGHLSERSAVSASTPRRQGEVEDSLLRCSGA